MAETYSEYLDRLRTGITKDCGASKAETILTEAKAHLEEGIEELTGCGLSRQGAEETVMARFGDTSTVCKWYAEQHQRPSVWQASRWPVAMVTLATLFWSFQNQILPIQLMIHFGSLIVMNTLLALTIIACFKSKRFTSGVILLAATGVYVMQFAGFCFFSVPAHWQHGDNVVARWSVPAEVQAAKVRLAWDEKQLAISLRGQKAFQAAVEPAAGVGEFHDSRGYLSQIYITTRDPRIHVYFGRDEVEGIVSTYGEARSFWIKQPSMFCEATGKREIFYLAQLHDEIFQEQNLVKNLPLGDSIPFAKKWPIYANSALYAPLFAFFFGLIADVSGGVLRLVAEKLRARKRTGPITS